MNRQARRAQILPGPRCGWPDKCTDKNIDHDPEPGTRRIWGYHDTQCQVPNPRPARTWTATPNAA